MCQLVELRGRGREEEEEEEEEEEGREKRERETERETEREGGEEEEGKPWEGLMQTRAPTCVEGLHQLEDQIIECGRVLRE